MKVGVIGAGTMGQGIAKAFAQVEGFTVALCDIKQEWADGGKNKIAAGYAKLVAKGKLDQAEVDRRMAAITAGLKEDLCADCDLIVEAAFEDMKVKQTTFGELDKICKPECVFASNTSSLSITEIGKGLTRPLVGMHFFNPADRMKLIEVIAGVNTPAETVETIKKISVEIGKTPVQVNEAAGFVVNRILIPMINEAIGLVETGVASVEDIDKAMMLGANHPMGPLALGDFIGLDVCLAIMNVLYSETGDPKYRPALLLKKMVRGGLLGRNESGGNLTLLSGEVGRGSGDRSSGNGLSGGILGLGKLSLRVGKLLLGGGQTTLKIDNLGEHGVDLGGQGLQEDVDLGGIIAALGLRESLSLDVSRGNSHNKFSFIFALAPCARRELLSQFYMSIPIRSCRTSFCTNCNAIIATTGEKSMPPMGGINRRKRLSHGPQTLSSTAAISCSNPPCFIGIHVIKQ